jgi:ribosomal protein S17E
MDAANISFTCDDLYTINDTINDAITNAYNMVFEKKLLSTHAENINVKHDFEDDISYIKEGITELFDVKDSVNQIIGYITTIVENQVRNPKKFGDVADGEYDKFNVLAYEYNAEDLNEGKGNSDAREHVWVDNVYCVVEAC